MNRRDYIVEAVMKTGNVTKEIAEDIVVRLGDEGVLSLGYGEPEVDKIVEKFTTTFGTTKTSKQDRWAAHRLAQKYGAQAVTGIIGLLGNLSHEKYAPVCNSVSELESKWVSVLSFLRAEKGDEVITT